MWRALVQANPSSNVNSAELAELFKPVDVVLRTPLPAENGASLGPTVAAVTLELADETLRRLLLNKHRHLHDAAHVSHTNSTVQLLLA